MTKLVPLRVPTEDEPVEQPATSHSRGRSTSPLRSGGTRGRARSRSPPPDRLAPTGPILQPIAALGDMLCPHDLHCGNCATAGLHPTLKPSERVTGCCARADCPGDADEFAAAIGVPPGNCDATSSAGTWRFASYKRAFRELYGIGRQGVQITFPTCVYGVVRDAAEAQRQAAQAAQAAQGEAQAADVQGASS
jgi:hypothetical protein